MSFPIPQCDVEEPSMICIGLLVGELDIFVMQVSGSGVAAGLNRTHNGSNRMDYKR